MSCFSLKRWVWACAPSLLLLGARLCAMGDAPKRVLVLDSFGRDVAPYSAIVSSFRTTLAREIGAGADIYIYEESLEMGWFPDPAFEQRSTILLEQRFADRPLDLIVPIGSPACRLAMQSNAKLFTSAPILCLGADQRLVPLESLRTNSTLITQNIHPPDMIEDILQLKPDTTNIVVVLGSSPLEKFWADQCRREWQPLAPRVSFSWLDNLSLKQITRKVQTLPPHSSILFLMLILDADGVPYDQDEPLKLIHAAASAPIFGYFRSRFGQGNG